jgi:hypothetical protein
MNIIKSIFGGGGSSSGGDGGLYFYVKPRGCEEVVQIRINPNNDLSISEGGGYFVQKTVRGAHRCFNPAEMTLHFDKSKKLSSQEVTGGEFVDEEAFEAWQQAFEAKKAAARAQNQAVDEGRAAESDTSNR